MSIVPFGQIRLKDYDKLPPHITYEQYRQMLDAIDEKYRKKTDKSEYFRSRDRLLLRLCWETGARIGDIVDVKVGDVDFKEKILKLRVKKRKNVNHIPLGDDILLEMSNYIRLFNIKERLFDISYVMAWKIIRAYGRRMVMNSIHPHMFRHGLAIHLLKNNVPIPIIAARLGHSSVMTTMNYYLVITPELQRQYLKNLF
jgi:integrase/recombinase XerD